MTYRFLPCPKCGESPRKKVALSHQQYVVFLECPRCHMQGDGIPNQGCLQDINRAIQSKWYERVDRYYDDMDKGEETEHERRRDDFGYWLARQLKYMAEQ